MGYIARTGAQLRTEAGSLLSKLARELGAIAAVLGGSTVVKVPLKGGALNAFAFAWENPEPTPIVVTKVIMDISKPGGTATAVIDVGAAPTATDTAEDLIKDADANATAVYASTAVAKLTKNGGALSFITGKILTAKAEALEGTVLIYYTPVV
jgi:hypothetical protein